MLSVTAAHLVYTIHLQLLVFSVQLVITVLNILGTQSHVERANVRGVESRLVMHVPQILAMLAQHVPVTS